MPPEATKQVYQITGNNKEQSTTLCIISAASGGIPPMLNFPGERFGYNTGKRSR